MFKIFNYMYLLKLEMCPWDTDAPLMKNSHILTKLKQKGSKLNPVLVNINDYIKFGKILSICSQDIERK